MVRALDCGSRGRWFESNHRYHVIFLEHLKPNKVIIKERFMTELRIWLSRICSFLPPFLFGTFSVCIPWKMAHLNMSETDLSFVILTFGIAMIFSIQICRIVLMPKFGTIHLMPLGGLLFSILFYFWTLSLDYLTFIS